MDENAPDAKAKLSLLPSEYFKRQIYATTWFEHSNLAALIDSVGEDNIMFETDFPHPTCLYPDPLKTAEANMRASSPTVRRKILGENAVRSTGSESSPARFLSAASSCERPRLTPRRRARPSRAAKSPMNRVAGRRRR